MVARNAELNRLMDEAANQYMVRLVFTNLDENLNTNQRAYIDFYNVVADNPAHADLLAKRLEKVFGADDYEVEAAED